MINRQELLDSIDECEKQPFTPAIREKLSQLYIIYDHFNGYSASNKRQTEKITAFATSGESDFLKLIDGKNVDDVMPIFSEMVATVKILQPALYNGFIQKLKEI